MRLNKFLKYNNILADQQLGFRKGRSTTHAVTDFYSQICNNLDNGKHSCVLLLNLKKLLIQSIMRYCYGNYTSMALGEVVINSSKVICQTDSSLYVLMELLLTSKK